MARNDALRFCVLAALVLLASACALSVAPTPIPADQVLAPPAPLLHGEVAMSEEFHVAGIGRDQLRGTLSAE